MDKTFIIAEMSANHCKDKGLAKRIIEAASESGADAVKIQTYTADTMTLDCRGEEFKISGGTLWDGKYFHELYREAETPWEWFAELGAFARERGLEFFSTPFDASAVDFLESQGCPIYKIASFEAFDFPLIRHAASKMKPMIISVGVSSLEEIRRAVDVALSAGCGDLTILKCTSAYPARLEDMNLRTISDMIEKFGPLGVKVGLSDHSMSVEPAVAAVALGARVVEKHFTLSRSLGGPDAGFSLEPREFAQMAASVRNTEKLMGRADYGVNEKNRIFGRSLFVAKDIAAGEEFTPENIRSVRPSSGMHPGRYDEVIGRRAASDLKFGTPLREEHIK